MQQGGADINNEVFSQGYQFLKFHHEYPYSWMTESCPKHFLAYMCRGRGRLSFAQTHLDVTEGDVFYIPHGIGYRSRWEGNEGIIFHSYGFSFLPISDQKDYDPQKIPLPPELAARVRDIPTDRTIDSKTLGIFYAVLADILPYMSYEQESRRGSVCDRALAFMADHVDCTVEEVAKHCHVSESVIYSAFRRAMGTTPNAQRIRLLCERAVDLLIATDRPIENISAELGFSSSSYFRKVLHAHTGMTPTQIRKRMPM